MFMEISLAMEAAVMRGSAHFCRACRYAFDPVVIFLNRLFDSVSLIPRPQFFASVDVPVDAMAKAGRTAPHHRFSLFIEAGDGLGRPAFASGAAHELVLT